MRCMCTVCVCVCACIVAWQVVTWARVFNVGEDRSTVKNAVLVCNVVYLGFTLFEVGSLLVINDTWNFVSVSVSCGA